MTPTFPTLYPTAAPIDQAASGLLTASELRQAIVAIQLVGPATIAAHTVALEAIRRTYPQLPVRRSRDLADALTQPVANGPELMILLSPKTGEVDTAAATFDARGLPRWSVITRGSWAKDPFSRFIGIAAEDWNATVLAHVLVYAAARPALERENVRLRGDLRTIGRRLAHDLRTPLNCISTASEALAEQFTRTDSVEALMIQSISASVTEAETLIDGSVPSFSQPRRRAKFRRWPWTRSFGTRSSVSKPGFSGAERPSSNHPPGQQPAGYRPGSISFG